MQNHDLFANSRYHLKYKKSSFRRKRTTEIPDNPSVYPHELYLIIFPQDHQNKLPHLDGIPQSLVRELVGWIQVPTQSSSRRRGTLGIPPALQVEPMWKISLQEVRPISPASRLRRGQVAVEPQPLSLSYWIGKKKLLENMCRHSKQHDRSHDIP